LVSHQGIRGGYSLARPASQMSVADVIEAIDGPLTVTACSSADERCDQYAKCNVRDPLWRLKDRIINELSACTIAEIASDRADEVLPVAVSRRPADVRSSR
jgi:Rrf2 family protein